MTCFSILSILVVFFNVSPLRFCPPSDQKAQASAQKRSPANSVGPSGFAYKPSQSWTNKCQDGHLWVPRAVWLRSRPGWTSCFVASVATSTMKTRSLGFGHNAIMATTQCSWKCTLISFTISKICLFLRAGETQNQHHTNLWAPLAVDSQTQSVVLSGVAAGIW